MSSLVQQLREFRVRTSQRQGSVARSMGVDDSYVSNLERGHKLQEPLRKIDLWAAGLGARIAVVPLDRAIPEEITALPADEQALLLRLARVLTVMPVEQQAFLADQVDLWTHRYGSPSPAIAAEPEPDVSAARGR